MLRLEGRHPTNDVEVLDDLLHHALREGAAEVDRSDRSTKNARAFRRDLNVITKFFLEPKPLQFAVGLAGGCELMGAAINALLSEHVGWVDVAADAKNAFNSFLSQSDVGSSHREFSGPSGPRTTHVR